MRGRTGGVGATNSSSSIITGGEGNKRLPIRMAVAPSLTMEKLHSSMEEALDQWGRNLSLPLVTKASALIMANALGN